MPTGSSTSAPAPATTAAGSSSRAHPPTLPPPAPPSPASTSRPTSAPDQALADTCPGSRIGRHDLVEVEVPRRLLLEPEPVVLRRLLEEVRCVLEHVGVARLGLVLVLVLV